MIARRPLHALAATLLVLAGCGGPVAPGAPTLLTADQIDRSAVAAQDLSRSQQEAATLAWRAQRLRERADRLRRTGIEDPERLRLLRRAEELKQR